MRHLRLLLLILSGLPFIANAQNGTELIKLSDLLKVKQASSITLTDDGKKLAFVVTNIQKDDRTGEEDQYFSQIWIAQTDVPGSARQITWAKESSAQPAWSPDGKTLAFVRIVNERPQIFLMGFDGGDAMQLTKIKSGASNPVWSPDGKQIAFTTSFNAKEYANDSTLNPGKSGTPFPLEKPGRGNDALVSNGAKADPDGDINQIRAWLAKNEADKKAKVINRLQFQGEASTSGEWSISHVYITDITPDSKALPVTKGFFSYSNPQFISPTLMMVQANLDSFNTPDKSQEQAIYTVNTNGSNLTKLTGAKDARHFNGALSNNKKFLAYLKGRAQFNTTPGLVIMSMDGKQPPVEINIDRNKSDMVWGKGDKYLYVSTPSNGGTVIQRIDPLTKQVTVMGSLNEGISSFDIKEDKMAFVKISVESPYEVYAGDAAMKNVKVITELNSSWLKSKKLVMPEKHVFTNNAGQEVEYWVMKPANYTPGKKYPLLLEIHGGPSAMWGPGESSMWHEFQFFCAKGYGVVYSNPRGSGGYTEAFLRANVNDWSRGPASDVLTALDKTVAEGWADTSKLCVTGGSYAGYLVAWLVGNDHRFKAACAQRGVYDLRTFFGEGNAWRLVPSYFSGYPWEKTTYDIIERESPINYVQNVRTPLIMFHGENDLRTGVISSEQFYKSLKVLGRPVEYVRHPGATHEITRSGNNRQRMDQMLRTYEFFERYIIH
ncbi:MAG: S9 family peptidase [Chitinophagaceae bacterium]